MQNAPYRKIFNQRSGGAVLYFSAPMTSHDDKSPTKKHGAVAMSTEQDIKLTLRTIAREIARQQRDGLKVSEATLADLESAARGETDTDEVTRRIYQRLGTQPPASVP